MPVPSAISDLSTTASLNSPAGSESPSTTDDYLRAHASFIKQTYNALPTASNQLPGASLADSAVTTAKLADSVVTTAKLADGAATGAKLGSDVVVITGNQTVGGVKTLSSNPVLSAGTANGVPYLNGSKVLTSGSALTFDPSTGLGIGTSSPEARLNVAAANPTNGVLQFIQNTSTSVQTGALLKMDVGNVGSSAVGIPSGTANALAFYVGGITSASERMRLDASGNLGLGVTPSAWVVNTKAMQVGTYLSMWEGSNGSANSGFGVYEGGVNTFNYRTTGDTPTMYRQLSGGHSWYTAPSGTAGDPISFTQAMTLDASGNLFMGPNSVPASGKIVIAKYDVTGGDYITFANRGYNTTHGNTYDVGGIYAAGFRDIYDPAYIAGITFERSSSTSGAASAGAIVFRTDGTGVNSKPGVAERARIDSSGNFIQTVNAAAPSLTINGTLSLSLASNTSLRISVRGSDGVTRTGTIALA